MRNTQRVLRGVMTVHAWLLLGFGLAGIFAPGPFLVAYGVAPDLAGYGPPTTGSAVLPMARLLGLACMGFGVLLLVIRSVATERQARTVALSLCVVTAVSAPLVIIQQIAIWESTLGRTTATISTAVPIAYGLSLLRARTAQRGDESAVSDLQSRETTSA